MPPLSKDPEEERKKLNLDQTPEADDGKDPEIRIADEAQLKIWREEAAREGMTDRIERLQQDFGGGKTPPQAPKKEEAPKAEAPKEPAPVEKKEESVESLKDKIQEYINQISRLQNDLTSYNKKPEEAKPVEPAKPKEEFKKKEEPVKEEKPKEEVRRKEEPKEAKKEEKAAKPEKTKEETAEAMREKIQDYKDQIVRLQADFSNFRKRAEKEKVEAIRFGREVILEQMIGLNDVMESALRHAQTATDVNALKKGFEMVLNEFARFLKSEGAEPLKTVGHPFDPHLHEAVEQVETENEKLNNIIVEELQKGYVLDGRLLRPAKVKVAKLKE